MPITEIVRAIAQTRGTDAGGRSVLVELWVDTDGGFGDDDQARGFPAFWIRAADERHGPFEHEDQALAFALRAYDADLLS